MNASGPESVSSSAIRQTEASSAQISNHINSPAPGIETQLHGAADIASARNFFVPKVDMPAAALTGIEHSSVAAMKAAEGAISPMLQLIMRLPGHLGLFSSFLEAFKNLFFSHDLLSNLNLGDIASGIDLSHAAGLSHISHLGHGLGGLSTNLHAFHNLPTDMVTNVSGAHLHISPFDSLKQSMNVSAGVDLKNPQFEGISASSHGADSAIGAARGDSVAGPSLSAQAITPKLSPAERIFSSKSFESASNSSASANNLMAFNTQAPTNAITTNFASSNFSGLASSPPNALSAASPDVVEHMSAPSSSNMTGLHAKALSLDGVLNKSHSHVASDHGLVAGHKHIANNPFSKLASSTRQAFESAQKATTSSHSYSIKSGDSLWKIANQELGSGARWHDIYNLNQDTLGADPSLIKHGTAINLPEAGHQTISHPSPSSSTEHSTIAHKTFSSQYTVKPGDSLWQISKNVFGNGDKWSQLYKLNGSTIGGNPSVIFSGQKLALSGNGINSIPTHLPVQSVDQLAVHSAPSSTIAHNQPAISHPARSVHHEQSTIAQISNPVAQNHSVIADNHISVQHQHAQTHAVTDNKIAQVAHANVANGLKVEVPHEKVLSGPGGAQAANDPSTAVNKLSNLSAAKTKSVVSFSLAPDLAQW